MSIGRGRYERHTDPDTGRTWLHVEPGVYVAPWSSVRPLLVFDHASLETMAARVRELDDPRLARVQSIRPLHIEGPSEPEPELTDAEGVELATELARVTLMLNAEGILFDPRDAWAVRQGEGVGIRVPAPTRSPRWHFHDCPRSRLLRGRVENPRQLVVHWLRPRVDPTGSLALFLAPHEHRTPEAFATHLKGHAPEAAAVFRALAESEVAPALLDLDLALEMAEARMEWAITSHRRRYFVGPVGAAFHHRGCVRLQAGDRDGALRDLEHSARLDPKPRYLTSLALCLEPLDPERAGETHDRAIEELKPGSKEAASKQDVSRTYLGRAFFRERRGDLTGARGDIEAAGEAGEDVGVHLTRVRAKLAASASV